MNPANSNSGSGSNSDSDSAGSSQPLPKLRLAAPESTEELARRFKREQRALLDQRERELESTPSRFRIGSVPYLNAAPLTRGIEDQIELDLPSQLAARLRAGELDAALVSITEALFTGAYDILDGIGISSLGEVKSVILAHRNPICEATEIHCDPASLTSISLLRVLLAEQGIRPEFRALDDSSAPAFPDYALVIGDRAIDFTLDPHEHQIWDLGTAWQELTGLPFVYAVWVLRRGIDNAALKRQLREARDFGLDTLDSIIASRPEYSHEFRKDYLGWHIHYHVGSDEKRGLARFIELLRKHTSQPVHEPRFVS